jgi:hypothetical protein
VKEVCGCSYLGRKIQFLFLERLTATRPLLGIFLFGSKGQVVGSQNR